MAANYREGEFVPATRTKNFYYLDALHDNPVAGKPWRGPVDWNDADNLRRKASLARVRGDSYKRAYAAVTSGEKGWGRDRLVGPRSRGGYENPYYSQGLGPASYKGKYRTDQIRTHIQWFEASERKFLVRAEELDRFAAHPGGEKGYAADQAAKKLLGKPRAEGARAAELLRQGRRQAGGGGAAPAQAGRQGQRARSAERRRMASNDATVGGGSSPRKRLHAKQLLRQPLGAGTQSAAQVLG